MKTLLLMRHAKSSWSSSNLTDFERPLNLRGQTAAPLMAKHLVSAEAVPDQILCSSARRTQETVERMWPLFPHEPAMTVLDELYHARPSALVAAINQVSPDVSRLLVVGHNPGMAELLLAWSAQHHDFPTAGIASFAVPDASWSKLHLKQSLELTDFWKPKELPTQT